MRRLQAYTKHRCAASFSNSCTSSCAKECANGSVNSCATGCAELIAVALLTAALVPVGLAARMAAPMAMERDVTAVPMTGRSDDEPFCLRVLERYAASIECVLVLWCCTAT